MNTPPRPTTSRAILISAGFHKPTTTVHHYKTTRKVLVKDAHGVESPAWEHVFRCARTGAERRWGIDDAEGAVTNGHSNGHSEAN